MLKSLKKYNHVPVIVIYLVLYLLCFAYLEKTVVYKYNLIHMWIDDYIPFIEAFIVPYLLWFPYVAVTVVYFIFHSRTEYFQLISFLMIGMTVFLIVSYVYPNGHLLRPTVYPRHNIFTTLVKMLHSSDTPTNILPSIHVYNSIGVNIAISRNETLGKYKWIKKISCVLMVSIILSTMFLKQHSVVDVVSGILLAVIVYIIIYKPDLSAVRERLKYESAKRYI